MIHLKEDGPLLSAGSTALCLGLAFGLIDLLLAQRDAAWQPQWLIAWAGWAVFVLLYGLVIGILALFFHAILRLVLRQGTKHSWALSAPFVAAGYVFWRLALVGANPSAGAYEMHALAVLVVFGVCLSVVEGRIQAPRGLPGLMGTLGLLGAAGVATAARTAFFFHAGRNRIVLALVVLFLASYGLLAGAGILASRLQKARVRSVLMALAVFSATVPATLTAVCWAQASSKRPAGLPDSNIVLMTFDALRADYVQLYGGQVAMPSFEALAERGTLFECCYAPAPWTTPSVQAMLISRYPKGLDPNRTRDEQIDDMTKYWLGPSERTLTEMLAAKGYATAAFLGNTLLDQPEGVLRGFQHYVIFDPTTMQPHALARSVPTARFWLHYLLFARGQVLGERPIDSSEALVYYAEQFVGQFSGQPFFLWIHFMDPHSPYDPPEKYRDALAPWPWFWPPGGVAGLLEGTDTLTPDERAIARHLYEGEMRYVDECAGRVLDAFNEPRLADETYFIASSDHGEELWDRGRWGHGHGLHQELLHVPLVIAGPSVACQRRTEVVSLIDLVPTMADWASVPQAARWQGSSLSSLLGRRESEREERACFASATTAYAPEPQQAIRLGPHRLIHGIATGKMELYDLRTDPKELNNLAESRLDVAASLLEQLETWRTGLDDPSAAADKEPGPDAELMERMRAMGYVR